MMKNYAQKRLKQLSELVSGSKKYVGAILIALLVSTSLVGQTLVNVLPNNNSTSGNARAPQGTRLFVNTVYIILPSEMAAYGADNVTSVGWTWNNPLGGGAPTTQSIATTGTLKIYMQNTTDIVYSKGTTFSTAGMTKVYDGNISIPATAAQINIDLPVGGPGTSTFTTIAGQGVYIAFEYNTTPTLATPIGAPTVSCNSLVGGSLGTYQSQTAYGTAMAISAFRPETRLGSANSDFVQVLNLFTLGTTPSLFGNPQPLQAVVKNASAATKSFNVDFVIQEKVSGTIRYSSSIPVTLGAGLTTTVDDFGWNATLNELDTAIVSVAALPGETITTNNSKGYRHNVTADSYNYADISASTGGVGYGTGEGLILNRYHIEGCTNVKQVRVFMGDANSTFNIVYAVVMDAAGTIVGQSADYTILPIDIGNYVTFDIVTPPNFTDADYYVGLAQTANLALAYYPVGTQSEPFPARNNAYYATGLAGGIPLAYTTLGRFVIEGVITPLSTTPTTSGDVTICLGESTDLSVTDGILNPFATYNWYTDGCGTTLVGTGSTISVNPGVSTTYYVRAEDPCNGVNTACGSLTVTVETPVIWYADADGDTYGDAGTTALACDAPAGYIANNTDCNDGNASINPAGTEVCNGLDDNCDGSSDEGLLFTTYYADVDGDTYGDAGNTTTACDGTPSGYVSDDTDCNDLNATVYPGAVEICDGLDNNCDGTFDEGTATATITPAGAVTACKGTGILLSANTGVGYTYQWFKDETLIPGAVAATYNALKPGAYRVQVTIPEGCFELSSITTVTILASPNANISAPNGTSLCTTVKLKASYGVGYTWQWELDGSPIGGATAFQYFATTPGNYTCVVTHPSGCSRETAALTVTACREGDVALGAFEVYPNPSTGEFMVSLNLENASAQTATINVYNAVGAIVYSVNTNVNNGAVQQAVMLDAPAGVYLIKVAVEGAIEEYNSRIVITK
jgi:hypothetical protein